MPEFGQLRAGLATARAEREAAADRLSSRRAELAEVDERLRLLRRAGKVTGEGDDLLAVDDAEAVALLTRWRELAGELERLGGRLGELKQRARRLGSELAMAGDPRQLVAELDDRTPFVLVPVRVEGRFLGGELRVRIVPDELAVGTHEAALTRAELDAGMAFWEQVWRAGRDQERERDAWRALVRDFDGPRAAWVAEVTAPRNDPVQRPTAPVAPDRPLDPPPDFPAVELRESSWTRPPLARILPDRFVVTVWRGGNPVHEVVGQPILDQLQLGPDPLQVGGGMGQPGENLDLGDELAWLADFDRAEAVGMAVRIPLGAADDAGFDRLTVLGLHLGSDRDDSRRLLEQLFDDHHYTDGLALVPQGTPTNNTGEGPSGFDRAELTDEGLFEVERAAPRFQPESDEHRKADGQRLCEALGVDLRVLAHVRHADRRDFAAAEAMSTALFRGTLGYYLEEMLAPAVDLGTIRRMRGFFVRNVRGRGSLPAVRAGRQPYGVLPTTAFSRFQPTAGELQHSRPVHDVVVRLDPFWQEEAERVAQVGRPGSDPDRVLLEVLGLQPSSIEYHARQMTGPDYLHNLLFFAGAGSRAERWFARTAEFGARLLERLRYDVDDPDRMPRIFRMSFFRRQTRLLGPLVEDLSLSETRPLQALTTDGRNYLAWLAGATLDELRTQNLGDGPDGQPIEPPTALLYLLARHALLLDYFDAAAKLLVRHTDMPPSARAEVELLNHGPAPSLSRWDLFEAKIPQVSGQQPLKSVLSRPPEQLAGAVETAELAEAKQALAELAVLPTAELERLLGEHLDTCAYRLDAWKLGLVQQRLLELRRREEPTDGPDPAIGCYLGAYGWLEGVQPRRPPAQVADDDPRIAALGGIDALPGSGPVVEGADNGGYVHTPSVGHATAAAVLRSGFLGHASTGQPDRLAVNLPSERVRRALELLDAVRGGQALEAVLGYRFERGLHDRSPNVELDRFILDLRARFPLVAGKVHPAEPDARADQLEARQVLDGVALVRTHRIAGYPYGVDTLPVAGPEREAIVAEVERLGDALDAVADLGLAESVYQIVQGNDARAGAVLGALASGVAPPDPEVVRTPRGGVAITHRVGVLLDAAGNPWAPVALTPRARVEPRLNAWLGRLLGDPASVHVSVAVGEPDSVTLQLVTLDQLALQPIDLVLAAGADVADATGVAELERRVVNAARAAAGVGDGTDVEIRWADRTGLAGPAQRTMFELLPLVRALRALLAAARPLTAQDFALPASGASGGDDPHRVDTAELQSRLVAARAALDAAGSALQAARVAVEVALADAAAPVPDPMLAALRQALTQAALFGLPDAVPVSTLDVGAAAARSLADQALAAERVLDARRAAAAAVLAPPGGTEPIAARVRRLLGAGEAIFGRGLLIVPRCTPGERAELAAAVAGARSLLAGAPPLAADSWLLGAGRVRTTLRHYGITRLLARTFDATLPALTPVQLPFRPDDRWQALPTVPGREPQGDTLSLVLERPGVLNGTGPVAGLQLDEWVEAVPNRTETTGLAFNADQPNSQPVQAILVVVPARLTGHWDWADLQGALLDTFDLARARAVEPDQLADSGLGQLLPAITPASSHVPATIGLNLLNNMLRLDVDFDRD